MTTDTPGLGFHERWDVTAATDEGQPDSKGVQWDAGP